MLLTLSRQIQNVDGLALKCHLRCIVKASKWMNGILYLEKGKSFLFILCIYIFFSVVPLLIILF